MTLDEALRILGLESNATLDDARKAYRDLVKVVHPDKDSSPGAKQRFILVQDAYEVITSQQWQGEPTRAEKARRERERKEREAREKKERIRREKERAERERQERKEKQQRYTDAYVFSFLESGMEKVTKLKQYAAAINDFDNVLEYLSDGYNSRYVHDVYYWRGMAKYFLDQYGAAVQDFDEMIRLRPNYAGAYYWRGNAKFGLKQDDGACQDYEKANALVTEKKMKLDSWGESLLQ